jgi:hypothetical protein
MKISRGFILISAALVLGFLAARWCAAQSANPQSARETKGDYAVAVRQLESFVTYLQETKQTNVLERFNNYMNTSLATQQSADLGLTLAILQRLRDGRTNSAMELLEGRLNSDITGFVAVYRELPTSLREKMSLKPLAYAREYRVKFPFKHKYPIVDEGVVEALKVLDEKPAK